MIKKEEVYRIGRLGKAHGIHGEVTFQFDDDVFDRTDADYLIIDVDGILVPFFIEEYRFRSDCVALMKFEGVDTQERARELTNSDVFFPRSLSLNSQPSTLNSQHSTLNSQHSTLNPQLSTLNPQHSTLNSQPSTLNSQPSTLNAQHSTLSYAFLVGFTIVDAATGRHVGVIDNVDVSTLNILFCLEDDTLIPAAEELIEGIDTERKEITLNIPEGLLDL